MKILDFLILTNIFFIGLVSIWLYKNPTNKWHNNTFPQTSVKSKQVHYKNLPKADLVEVIKSKQIMHLKKGNKIIRTYKIALGEQPKGHKQREGDEKTPEGTYTLDWKNEKSIAYRSIHISYPNAKDKAHAKKLGVSAGGNIMIHGQMNGMEKYTQYMQQRNWTDGCIAVTNPEMDEIMHLVKVGTKIKIRW